MPKKNPKYDLKQKYQRTFEIGIIMSISLIILAFRFFPNFEIPYLIIDEPPDLITAIYIPPTGKPAVPPPPKPQLTLEVDLIDEDLLDLEIDETDLESYKENNMVKLIEEDNNSETFEIFYAVEKMPEIIGGLEGLQRKVLYPEIALRAGIQGKVILQAVIGLDGEITDVKVIKGIGGGCEEAAIEALLKTQFTPGTQRGKQVLVAISIPIVFRLRNSN
jgi:protein TonB